MNDQTTLQEDPLTLDPPSDHWFNPVLDDRAIEVGIAAARADWTDPPPSSLAGLWAAHQAALRRSNFGDPADEGMGRAHQITMSTFSTLVDGLKAIGGSAVQVEADLIVWWNRAANKLEHRYFGDGRLMSSIPDASHRALCDGREVRG